jgi:UDP-N-acetylglucosamine 2-epimerase (non-hydrolysing)
MRIACVVGARPNFVKIAPIMSLLRQEPELFTPILVHTGQHYDFELSELFFRELHIPEPDYHLEVGPGTPARQTGEILHRFDAICERERFDRVLLVGDVTSTLACAVVAAKRCIPIDHVEAGLRSFDRTMPEEINRVVTDALTDTFFVTEESGLSNLLREGQAREKIQFVGNVMIDSLWSCVDAAQRLRPWETYGLPRKGYGVVTLHRPSNVDDMLKLRRLIEKLIQVSCRLPMIFPVHPRTRSRLEELALDEMGDPGLVTFTAPLGYLEFLGLMEGSQAVITDSGGIQEETTALGIPCLTLRPNTERPVTVEMGTNTLVDDDPAKMDVLISSILAGTYKKGGLPPLWDGRASHRIVAVLREKALEPATHGFPNAT